MTGLDLESFLLVLRADLTTWVVLGLATLVLALMVWSCWRSRRALRNCLVLSLAGHLGLVLYGSTIPAVMSTLASECRESLDRTHLRRIRIDPVAGLDSPGGVPRRGEPTRKGASTATTGASIWQRRRLSCRPTSLCVSRGRPIRTSYRRSAILNSRSRR